MLTARWQVISPEAMHVLAQGIASVLRPGDVIALEGELGAGKTTFVRGVVDALAPPPATAASLVASPTFVLVHVYPLGNDANAIRRVVHVDAYRLTSNEDLESCGWDHLFDPHTGNASADAIALVEWPQRLDAITHAGQPIFAPMDQRATLRIAHRSEGVRLVEASLPLAWQGRPRLRELLELPLAVCPKTRQWVSPTTPSYPFLSERARDADLFGWLSESYTMPRAINPGDDAPDR